MSPPALPRAEAAPPAVAASAAAPLQDRMLAARAAGRPVALAARAVIAVTRPTPVTRVPGSVAALLGLATWRGAPLPVVSLAALLGEPVPPVGPASRVLVQTVRGAPVGLLVEALDGCGTDAEPMDPAALLVAASLAAPPNALRHEASGHEAAGDNQAADTRAPPATVPVPAARPLLLFTIAGQHHALPLAAVHGILRVPTGLERLPGTDPAMLGAVPHGAGVLPVLSLRTLLGLATAAPTPASRLVLTTIAHRQAALLVDAVHRVARIPARDIGPVPALLVRGRGEARIAGLARLGAGLALILDPHQLVDAATLARLGTDTPASTAAAAVAVAPPSQHRFVTFTLDGDTYGLPIEAVVETIRHPGRLACLPHAPAFVAGVLTHRGRTIAVIDRRLHANASAAGIAATAATRIIVVALGGLHAGFAADAVHGVIALEAASLAATPRDRPHGAVRPRGRPRPGSVPRDRPRGPARRGRARPPSHARGHAAMIRLLVVDDSPLVRRLMAQSFRAAPDFELAFARDGADALAQLETFQPHVITLDVQMPGMDGLACLDRIMLQRPTPVVMLSALTDAGADTTLRALTLGAVDALPKPAGAISLGFDALTPVLVERIRAAAATRPRLSARLAERMRLRSLQAGAPPAPRLPPALHLPGPPDAPTDRLVLVGTSTGGPPALDALLTPLPADFPWPIVVAQHMPRAFTAALARRLDRACALAVTEVTASMPLRPGHVFIGAGETDILVATRAGAPVVLAAPIDPAHRWHPSVDRLAASAIAHFGAPRLVGILMTGMGDDGAAPMAAIRAGGGRTIAEAEATAVVWGMPGALVRAGGAEFVTPLDAIAATLMDLAAAA